MLYARSTASDEWHRESERHGMERDAAEMRERHAPLPQLAEPTDPATKPEPRFPTFEEWSRECSDERARFYGRYE